MTPAGAATPVPRGAQRRAVFDRVRRPASPGGCCLRTGIGAGQAVAPGRRSRRTGGRAGQDGPARAGAVGRRSARPRRQPDQASPPHHSYPSGRLTSRPSFSVSTTSSRLTNLPELTDALSISLSRTPRAWASTNGDRCSVWCPALRAALGAFHLLRCRIPALGGVRVFNEIRALRRRVPHVIFSTAFARFDKGRTCAHERAWS